MMKQAKHIWRSGKTTTENLEVVHYGRLGFIPSSFPGMTDTIAIINRFTAHEKVYGDEPNYNNQTVLMPPERNIEALIKTLLNKYTQPTDLVSDHSVGSYSTGCTCILLPKHCE